MFTRENTYGLDQATVDLMNKEYAEARTHIYNKYIHSNEKIAEGTEPVLQHCARCREEWHAYELVDYKIRRNESRELRVLKVCRLCFPAIMNKLREMATHLFDDFLNVSDLKENR